jgi:nucleotide-binding universal stress UspA family protein
MSLMTSTPNARLPDEENPQLPFVSDDAHAIRRILVCVDRSPFSETCLQYALAVSKSLGAAITLLHVMQPARERSGLQTTDVVDWEISRQEAEAYLEKLVQEARQASGRQVDARLEQGHPAERIAAIGREIGADLTVLGSQGEHGAGTRDMGTTAQQVLEGAHGSVLFARFSGAAPAGAVSLKRILVPLDGSRRAESVLPTVVRIASRDGAELLLVFVANEPIATAMLSTMEDLEAARSLASRVEVSGKRYLEALREQLAHGGATVRTLVLRSADERQALLDLSLKERSDLIVLSAHGATCNAALRRGSFTVHLLAHSSVSLLVLQDLRDSELRGSSGAQQAPALRGHYPEAD